MHSSRTYFSTKWEGTSSTSPVKMLTREPVPWEHQPELTAIPSPCTATGLCEAQRLLEVAKPSAHLFPVWSKPIRKQNKTKNITTKKPKNTESHRFSCPSCKIQRRKGRKVSSNCLWNAVWSSKTLHFFLLRRFFLMKQSGKTVIYPNYFSWTKQKVLVKNIKMKVQTNFVLFGVFMLLWETYVNHKMEWADISLAQNISLSTEHQKEATV